IPLVVNLMALELIAAPPAPKTQTNVAINPVTIDRNAIQHVIRQLSQPETGLLSYPSILYFMDQEAARYETHKQPFSVLLMEMMIMTRDGLKPLPPQVVREVVDRIVRTKRRGDLAGHFEGNELVMVLPSTDRENSKTAAQRIFQGLIQAPTSAGNLAVFIGCATLPDDSTDLGQLMGGARFAKTKAQQSDSPVFLLGDCS